MRVPEVHGRGLQFDFGRHLDTDQDAGLCADHRPDPIVERTEQRGCAIFRGGSIEPASRVIGSGVHAGEAGTSPIACEAGAIVSCPRPSLLGLEQSIQPDTQVLDFFQAHLVSHGVLVPIHAMVQLD